MNFSLLPNASLNDPSSSTLFSSQMPAEEFIFENQSFHFSSDMSNSGQSTAVNQQSPTMGDKRIGKYIIKETIGAGTFSKTKLATDAETGRMVAVKILKPDLSDAALKTIFTEINALKAIKHHPNVIQLYDFGQQEYLKKTNRKMVKFLAMELAAGGELFHLVNQTGRFSEDLTRYYFRKLVNAVEFCH